MCFSGSPAALFLDKKMVFQHFFKICLFSKLSEVDPLFICKVLLCFVSDNAYVFPVTCFLLGCWSLFSLIARSLSVTKRCNRT